MNNNDSQFVHFQSAADLDAIPGDSTFASTWRIRNNGSTDWKLGYHLLRHNTGLIVRKRIPLFEATGKRLVAPGEEVDATILFTAPKEPGQYRHVFQLADDKGKPFGDQFWIEIVVVDEEEAGDVDGPPISPADEKLQTGMNINPDAPYSNPVDDDVLVGLDWVRYPFKAADKNRSLAESFAEYDPIVEAYADKGIGTLFVLNQQTVAGKDAPWKGGGDWTAYAGKFASAAGEIAAHYAHLGDKVSYEIWNEGDNQDTPWVSVYVPPKQFAPLLWRTAGAIRVVAPESKIIFGGLSTDYEEAGAYVSQVRKALGGELPVDAIGIHPYGRWPIKRPFRNWGFGKLNKSLKRFREKVADKPLWITEMGIVGRDKPLPEKTHSAVARFMRDLYTTVAQEHSEQVPAVIWFAWSDNMNNAGIVRSDGTAKSKIFDAFVDVRDRKLDGLA